MNRVGIVGQAEVTGLRFFRIFDVPFKLIAEMADGSSHGPGSSIAQRANGIAFNAALNVPQQVNIGHLSFSVFYVFQDLVHPAGAFAAGAALSATFMIVKTGECHGVTDNALVFIQYDKTA